MSRSERPRLLLPFLLRRAPAVPARGPTWEPGMPWPFVRSVIDRDEVDSTSDLALAMTQSGWSALPALGPAPDSRDAAAVGVEHLVVRRGAA